MAASTSHFVTCGGCGTEYIPRRKGCPFCGAPFREAILYEAPDGDFTITEADVDAALADARARGLAIADLMDPPNEESDP